MLAEDTLVSSYLVEVSGWDEDHSFFVENSQLACDELAGKLISLRHNIPEGSLIFLRLLKHDTSLSAIPMPFEARFVRNDTCGLHQFRLSPARPRQAACRYYIQ